MILYHSLYVTDMSGFLVVVVVVVKGTSLVIFPNVFICAITKFIHLNDCILCVH